MTAIASVTDRDRWRRAKELFNAVVDLPPADRAALLFAGTAGDDALRQHVASLLEEDDRAGDAMGTASVRRFRTATLAALPSMEGKRVGAYRIVSEIGYGGMGAVYLAERADAAFKRRVAIKVVRGMAVDSVIRRFEVERRILAQMQHPHIAQIIDAGSTDDGLPFFVMELVEGMPIDAFCRQRGLPVREKLQLFLRICSAVAYAHQNLIVHRDLKPANILVTSEGVPKLLDFGIAKFLDTAESNATLADLRIFTPEYASPEQLSGAPIGTSTDVYSLGVILYELLTGQRPHTFPTRVASDVLELMKSERVPAPAAAAREAGLSDRISRDLDNVTLKAIATDIRRRYSSVQLLADDISRILNGLPVTARRANAADRAGKFVSRHKAGVGAGVLVCASLVGGMIVSLRSAAAERHERQQAVRRVNDMRGLSNSLLFEFYNTLDSVPGTLPARQMMVARAAESLDRIAADAREDRSVEAQLAGAYDRLGSLTFDTATAMELHRKAVVRLRRLVAFEPHNRALLHALAEGLMNVADTSKISGDFGVAVSCAREAQSLARVLRGMDRTAAGPGMLLQQAYMAEAAVHEEAGETSGALAAFRRAFELAHELASTDPSNPARGYSVAAAESHFGLQLAAAGDIAKGLQHARTAVAIAQTLVTSDPPNARYRRLLWGTRRCLGFVLMSASQPVAAVHELETATALIQSLGAADPNDRGHQRTLAATLIPLGRAYVRTGQHAEARATFEKALVISRKLAGGDGVRVESANDEAEASAWIAIVASKEDPAAASRAYREALAIQQPLLARGSRNQRVLAALSEAAAALH